MVQEINLFVEKKDSEHIFRGMKDLKGQRGLAFSGTPYKLVCHYSDIGLPNNQRRYIKIYGEERIDSLVKAKFGEGIPRQEKEKMLYLLQERKVTYPEKEWIIPNIPKRLLHDEFNFIPYPSFYDKNTLNRLLEEPKKSYDPRDIKTEMKHFLHFNALRRSRNINIKSYLRCELDRQEFLEKELVFSKIVEQTRNNLIKENIGLVFDAYGTWSKYNSNCQIDQHQLISEGFIGLLNATNLFDVRKGFKFSTYAWSSIFQKFSRATKKESLYGKIFPVHLDKFVEKPIYQDLLDTKIEYEELEIVKGLIEKSDIILSKRESIVLTKRFGLDSQGKRPLEIIAEEIGVTRERIRQIENNAIEKLRREIRRSSLG